MQRLRLENRLAVHAHVVSDVLQDLVCYFRQLVGSGLREEQQLIHDSCQFPRIFLLDEVRLCVKLWHHILAHDLDHAVERILVGGENVGRSRELRDLV